MLGKRKGILTLIGGGVFGNPLGIIWESLLWALDEAGAVGAGPLEAIVNVRHLLPQLGRDSVLKDVRLRGGRLVEVASGAARVTA